MHTLRQILEKAGGLRPSFYLYIENAAYLSLVVEAIEGSRPMPRLPSPTTPINTTENLQPLTPAVTRSPLGCSLKLWSLPGRVRSFLEMSLVYNFRACRLRNRFSRLSPPRRLHRCDLCLQYTHNQRGMTINCQNQESHLGPRTPQCNLGGGAPDHPCPGIWKREHGSQGTACTRNR
jgi:hypothetical protein